MNGLIRLFWSCFLILQTQLSRAFDIQKPKLASSRKMSLILITIPYSPWGAKNFKHLQVGGRKNIFLITAHGGGKSHLLGVYFVS
jgi:hypothetical protein